MVDQAGEGSQPVQKARTANKGHFDGARQWRFVECVNVAVLSLLMSALLPWHFLWVSCVPCACLMISFLTVLAFAHRDFLFFCYLHYFSPLATCTYANVATWQTVLTADGWDRREIIRMTSLILSMTQKEQDLTLSYWLDHRYLSMMVSCSGSFQKGNIQFFTVCSVGEGEGLSLENLACRLAIILVLNHM